VTITTTKRLGALAIAAMFAVAACGGGATPEPSDGAPSGDAGSMEPGMGPVSGTINVSGSSTVEPISTGVAEAFRESNPDFNYTVEGPGTGDGFVRFCAGETDISDASRPIRDTEAADCQANGVEYVELKVAYDGLTVMTSPENTAVTCLSFADLYALTGPESTGFGNWNEASTIASELGSSTTFPDLELSITGPGEESGTFDTFVEFVMGAYAEDRGQDETTRPDYTSSANDNVIIEGITGSPGSLGWVGFAFAEENGDVVQELEVSEEPDGDCVLPTDESISDGSYPLSRPLFIYVNTAMAAENTAVAGYVDFYLADGTISTVLETVPYVNLPDSELAETVAAWEGSM
jgi:phosphate transport system substrate-binding protein